MMSNLVDAMCVYRLSLASEGAKKLPPDLRAPTSALFAIFSDLHGAAFATMNEAGWSAAALEDLYQHEGVVFYVAVRGESITGFAVFRSVVGEAELLTLAVSPASMQQGCAQALLDHALSHIRQQRVEDIFLEVRSDNVAAIHLYEKAGFKRIGMRKDYYKTKTTLRVDAYTFKKELR